MSHLLGEIGVLQKVVQGPGNPPVGSPGPQTSVDPSGKRLTDLVAVAIERFQILSKLDEMWNADVASGRLAHDLRDEQEITDLYRGWLTNAEPIARELGEFDRFLLLPSRIDEFQTCLENARGICTPDTDFFVGPGLDALRDQALTAFDARETVEIPDPRD